MLFKNFHIWRGRLPHWRADDVRYYVTFRHRRPLDETERRVLSKALGSADGVKWDALIQCVLPDQTEMILQMRAARAGRPHELSTVLECAKRKAGKLIAHGTGERFPPFYAESYDRIIRDEAELEERWEAIYNSPVVAELAETPEAYPGLRIA